MQIRLNAIARTLGVLVLGAAAAHSAQTDGPDRPDERFSVYVASELEDTEDTKYKSDKVRKELEKKIKDQKKWFIVAKTPDKAEILVNIVRHSVDEQMRHKLVSRVNVSGNGKNWVTETWSQERHFLEVRVDTFGKQRLVDAEDARENGGSLKKVSEILAENLEALCRENYEELSRVRREQP